MTPRGARAARHGYPDSVTDAGKCLHGPRGQEARPASSTAPQASASGPIQSLELSDAVGWGSGGGASDDEEGAISPEKVGVILWRVFKVIRHSMIFHSSPTFVSLTAYVPLPPVRAPDRNAITQFLQSAQTLPYGPLLLRRSRREPAQRRPHGTLEGREPLIAIGHFHLLFLIKPAALRPAVRPVTSAGARPPMYPK